MTVATTLVFSEYDADGSTTAFGLNAYCQTADQVEVLIDDVVQSDAAYTVSGLRSPTGVTATFSTAPTSGTVRVRRKLPLTQGVDTQNNEVTYQEVFDDALDRQVMVDQQLAEEIGRSIRFEQGETGVVLPSAADRGGMILGFDVGGIFTLLDAAVAGLATTLASLVTFLQAGVGAVVRSVEARLRETVSVLDFWESGEHGPAIEAALTYLDSIGGGTLWFPPGDYTIDTPVSVVLSDGVSIRIIGYGAVIDGTSVTGTVAGDTSLITLGGQRLTSSLLSASPSKGDYAVTTVTAVDAVAGEIVLITSTDLWNPERVYYYKGELAQVLAVSSATLDLASRLNDSYTNTTTTVHRLAMPSISVEGLEFVMDANQLALKLEYVRNPSVRRCRVHGSRYAGIYVNYFFGGSVKENEIWDAWYSGTGTSYGISLGTGQGLTAGKNNTSEARHGITVGGWEPSRDILISGNKCTVHPDQTTLIAIDCHGNVERAIIESNHAEGIIYAGINATIRGNTLTGDKADTLLTIFQEIDSDYYDISDNNFEMDDAGGRCIWVSPTVAGLNIERLTISGNKAASANGGIRLQPRSAAATGCSIGTLVLRNNEIFAGAAQAFALADSTVAAIYDIGTIDSGGNIYSASAYDAFHMEDTNPVGLTKSVGDTFLANRLNGNVAIFAGAVVELTSPTFKGDVGGAGDSRSVYYANTGRRSVINPTFEGVTYKAELATAGDYIENGWSALTPTILNTGAARIISQFSAQGLVTAYGAAAPVAGTWGVGDRMINSVPVVGQPKSWVCTVAGTPGTWVSEGNL